MWAFGIIFLSGGIPPHARNSQGMSVLELMAALVILAVLMTLTRPALDAVSPRWQLRAAAQQAENLVLWARNAAVSHGEPVQVLYDVPEGSCWVRVGDRTYSFYRLPRGVRFQAVRFGTRVEVTQDVAACRVFPDGTLDAHEVILRGSGSLGAKLTHQRLTTEAYYEERDDGAL